MPVSIHETLKDLLPADVVKQVEAALKDHKISIVPTDDYIPKPRFDEINNSAKEHKTRADKFEADVAALTKNAKNQEELTKSIADLTAANAQLKADSDARIAQIKRDNAIDAALRTHKAKNPKTVLPLLDLTKVKLTADDKIEGLEEQLAAIKKGPDAYLFSGDNPNPPPRKAGEDTGGNPIILDADAKMRIAAGLPATKPVK